MSPYPDPEPPPTPSYNLRMATHIQIAGWSASLAIGLVFGIVLSTHFDHLWWKVVTLGLLAYGATVVWVVSAVAVHWIRHQAHLSLFLARTIAATRRSDRDSH